MSGFCRKKTALAWNELDLKQWVLEWEETRPSAFSIWLVSYFLPRFGWQWCISGEKKKKKSSLFWIIHTCRNIIFTLNNEIPTCMISGYSGQLLLDSGFRACVPYFDVMRLKIIILKKCVMYAINYGAAVRGALHLGHFREEGMKLNVCKEAASLTRVTCYIERPINQAASSATELSSY